jgi:hypothetical protein
MDEHTTPPNPPDAAGSNAADDDVVTLRALTLALVHQYRGPQADAEPELLVGQVPADLPFTLPLPEGSRLLGTLVNEYPLVVLQSELEPDAVIAWYEERLFASGWQEVPPPAHRPVGFVTAEEVAHATHATHATPVERPRSQVPNSIPRVEMFQLGEQGPGLEVETFADPSGRTIVRLSIHREGATGPDRARFWRHRDRDPWAMMPALVPPADVRHWNDGGHGSTERVQLNGRLQTDLDLATVAARYAEQLEQHGWQRQDGGASGPVAWSTWRFSDADGKPWRGLFVLLQRAEGRERYWAHLGGEPVDPQTDSATGARVLG